jgi:hypothetical protein
LLIHFFHVLIVGEELSHNGPVRESEKLGILQKDRDKQNEIRSIMAPGFSHNTK